MTKKQTKHKKKIKNPKTNSPDPQTPAQNPEKPEPENPKKNSKNLPQTNPPNHKPLPQPATQRSKKNLKKFIQTQQKNYFPKPQFPNPQKPCQKHSQIYSPNLLSPRSSRSHSPSPSPNKKKPNSFSNRYNTNPSGNPPKKFFKNHIKKFFIFIQKK